MTDEQLQDFADAYGVSLQAARLALAGDDATQARQEWRRQLADAYGVDVRFITDERTNEHADG